MSAEEQPVQLDGRVTIIEPGDRVVVRVDKDIEAQGLADAIRERFPDVEFTFVRDGDVEFEAVKPAPDLTNWFTHHAPRDAIEGGASDVEAYQAIRGAGYALADMIVGLVPPSHERDVALDRVREAIMWANAGRACNPREE